MNVGQLSKAQLVKEFHKVLDNWKFKYDNGEIKWNVSNQFDLNIYEGAKSALDNMSDEKYNEFIKKCGHVSLKNFNSLYDISGWFNDYETPEISSVWYD